MKSLTIAGLLLLSFISFAQTFDTGDAFTMQQDLHSTFPTNQMFSLGYVNGVAETLHLTGAICLPEHFRQGEIAEVIYKYVDNHPTKLHAQRVSASAEALVKAYPCVGRIVSGKIKP